MDGKGGRIVPLSILCLENRMFEACSDISDPDWAYDRLDASLNGGLTDCGFEIISWKTCSISENVHWIFRRI